MIYTADHLDDARAVFLCRPRPAAWSTTTATLARQRTNCATVFSGMARCRRLLARGVDRTPTFYFDAITQLEMTSWSRGRVTLVGDAGYCPGPAVGGSTSLAVYGAYVLAGELAKARGDHVAAFAIYERMMMPAVLGSRSLARVNAKTLRARKPLGRAGSRRCLSRGVGFAVATDAVSWRGSTTRASGSTTTCRYPRTQNPRENHCGSGGLCVATSWSATPAG